MVEFKNFDHEDPVVSFDVPVKGQEFQDIAKFVGSELGDAVESIWLDSHRPKTAGSVNYKVVRDSKEPIIVKYNPRMQNPDYVEQVGVIHKFLDERAPVPFLFEDLSNDTFAYGELNGKEVLLQVYSFDDGNHYGGEDDLQSLGYAYGTVYNALKEFGITRKSIETYMAERIAFWDVVTNANLLKILGIETNLNPNLKIFHENEDLIRETIRLEDEVKDETKNSPLQHVLWDPHPHNVLRINAGNYVILDFENCARSLMPVSMDVGMAMHRALKMRLSRLGEVNNGTIELCFDDFITGIGDSGIEVNKLLLIPGARSKSITSLIRNGLRTEQVKGDEKAQYTCEVEIDKHFHNILELEAIASATGW